MKTVATLANYKENLDTLIEKDFTKVKNGRIEYVINSTMKDFAVDLVDITKDIDTTITQTIAIKSDVVMNLNMAKDSISMSLHEKDKDSVIINNKLNNAMKAFAISLIDMAREIKTKVTQQIAINDDIIMNLDMTKETIAIRLYERNNELVKPTIAVYMLLINPPYHAFQSVTLTNDTNQLIAIYESISSTLEI